MQKARPFDILPAIDLRGGRVVRLGQGDFDRETAYDDGSGRDRARVRDGGARLAPRRRSRRRADRRPGTSRGHRGDRCGGRGGRSGRGRGRPAGCAMPWPSVLEGGAARAVIGTAALAYPAFAGELVDRARGRTDRGRHRRPRRPSRRSRLGRGRTEASTPSTPSDASPTQGVQTFEVTAIDRDGLLGGPDLALYERLVALDRGAIIASGGIATLADLVAVRDIGLWRRDHRSSPVRRPPVAP